MSYTYSNQANHFSVFKKLPVINDQVGNLAVVIFSKRGTLSALDASEIKDSRLILSATAWNRRVDNATYLLPMCLTVLV